MTRTLAAAIVVAAVVGGCGGGSSTTAASAPAAAHRSPAPVLSGHATVAIRDFMYSPMRLTVRPGTRVTFHNYDQTAHTATALNGGFNTGTVEPGKSVTVTLKKPGTYRYHCLFHAFMVATIRVV